MQFELLCKDIEHQNGIAIIVFHLFGGFAIDGSDEGRFGQESVNKLGEGMLQVGEREFSQQPCHCHGVGNVSFSVSVSQT